MTPRRGNEERKLSSVLLLFSCCCLTRRDEYVYVARATLEWFSKGTGTSFQNGARSKNVDKKLGRERRRVVLKSDLAVIFLHNFVKDNLEIVVFYPLVY